MLKQNTAQYLSVCMCTECFCGGRLGHAVMQDGWEEAEEEKKKRKLKKFEVF